jgi:hypothetical protein
MSDALSVSVDDAESSSADAIVRFIHDYVVSHVSWPEDPLERELHDPYPFDCLHVRNTVLPPLREALASLPEEAITPTSSRLLFEYAFRTLDLDIFAAVLDSGKVRVDCLSLTLQRVCTHYLGLDPGRGKRFLADLSALPQAVYLEFVTMVLKCIQSGVHVEPAVLPLLAGFPMAYATIGAPLRAFLHAAASDAVFDIYIEAATKMSYAHLVDALCLLVDDFDFDASALAQITGYYNEWTRTREHKARMAHTAANDELAISELVAFMHTDLGVMNRSALADCACELPKAFETWVGTVVANAPDLAPFSFSSAGIRVKATVLSGQAALQAALQETSKVSLPLFRNTILALRPEERVLFIQEFDLPPWCRRQPLVNDVPDIARVFFECVERLVTVHSTSLGLAIVGPVTAPDFYVLDTRYGWESVQGVRQVLAERNQRKEPINLFEFCRPRSDVDARYQEHFVFTSPAHRFAVTLVKSHHAEFVANRGTPSLSVMGAQLHKKTTTLLPALSDLAERLGCVTQKHGSRPGKTLFSDGVNADGVRVWLSGYSVGDFLVIDTWKCSHVGKVQLARVIVQSLLAFLVDNGRVWECSLTIRGAALNTLRTLLGIARNQNLTSALKSVWTASFRGAQNHPFPRFYVNAKQTAFNWSPVARVASTQPHYESPALLKQFLNPAIPNIAKWELLRLAETRPASFRTEARPVFEPPSTLA